MPTGRIWRASSLEGAALGPEGRLGLEHHPGALREGDRHGVDGVHRHGDRQGHVDVGVTQGEERRAAPRVELDDLALDPEPGSCGRRSH